jgi:hypothetical protein
VIRFEGPNAELIRHDVHFRKKLKEQMSASYMNEDEVDKYLDFWKKLFVSTWELKTEVESSMLKLAQTVGEIQRLLAKLNKN